MRATEAKNRSSETAFYLGQPWQISKELISAKGMKPDIRLLRQGERCLVAKDFRNKGWIAAHLWGPLSLAYERFLLDKAAGMSGIPQVVGFENYKCLLITCINGEEIKSCRRRLDGSFFTKLLRLADDLHDRGVLHLDLGHKSNIMVDVNGNPAIIDFNSSLFLPPNRFFRPLIRRLALVDRYSILRLKVKYRPQECTKEEQSQVKFFLRVRKLWIFDRLLRKITNLSKRAPSKPEKKS
ncbi:MAG TPA: hypothetical protein ENN66_05460 [Proteobacteria bacterium]|nr:hypothetical protein [Pseudomonadota bacterium]